MDLLEASVARMLAIGKPIAFDAGVFSRTLEYEVQFGMPVQDAIVLASVVADLRRRRRREPKCFVSRNSKDFDDPAITANLESFGCRYVATFADAVRYVRRNRA